MTAKSRGRTAAACLIRSSRPRQPIRCPSCTNLSLRSYATAATSPSKPTPPPMTTLPPVTTSSPTQDYSIKAGILLSRPPLLTAPLTRFEKAFFFYQKRLNERLAMPFTRYFYFKKDTPGDKDWKIKARERNGAFARELGGYRAYGEEAWNDELLVQDSASNQGMGIVEPKAVQEALVRDSRVRAIEGKDGAAIEVKEGEVLPGGEEEEKPLKRVTAADRNGDARSLERRLERTLYLCVKKRDGGWGFPAGELIQRENLHQAAERVLVQTGGLNMNTWIVGHVPIGHHIIPARYSSKPGKLIKQGSKTFFMKGRIMAGQVNLEGNLFGLEDFKWLTKQEVQKHVSNTYFSWVKNMMADR